jgi:signal transduction histidine kinase
VARVPEKSGLLARLPLEEPEQATSTRARTGPLEDELLTVIGHDMRSPLSVVMMTADSLARSASDESSRIAARRLRSAGDRMLRVIEELVELARARRGRPIPLDTVPSDVGAICASVVADFALAHPGRVAFDAISSDLTAEVDLTRARRAVESMLSSALRHTRKKESITVAAADDGEDVIVTVWTPTALDESVVERVFEPFGEGPDGRVRSDAAGLSMFVAREVAQAHGGAMDVAADGAVGTTYRLRLPRCRA